MKNIVLLLFSSVFYSLGFGSYFYHKPLPIVSFLGALLFFLSLKDIVIIKQRMLYFFSWSLLLSISSIYWIPYTLRIFGHVPESLSYLGLILFSLSLMSHYIPIIFLQKLQNPLILSIIFSLSEQIFSGMFPSYLNTSLYSIFFYFPLIGQGYYLLLSLLLYYFLFSLVYKKDRELASNALGIFLIANIFFLFPKEEKTTSIALVQPNKENIEKLSENVLSSTQIIFWPEGSIPKVYKKFDSKQFTNFPFLKDNQDLITGYLNGTKNSIVHYRNNQIINTYDKTYLMPFGEKIPTGFNFLSSYLKGFFEPLTPGDGFKIFEAHGVKFITPICYEILKNISLGMYLHNNSIDFLVAPTDDSWYGKSSELEQHKYLAHLTGIFLGLPIVRTTSTGISQVMYPSGEVSESLDYETKGVLHHNLKTFSMNNMLFKNIMIYILSLIPLFGFQYLNRFKKK
jgi:apolipoprotein N-acyltransferase